MIHFLLCILISLLTRTVASGAPLIQALYTASSSSERTHRIIHIVVVGENSSVENLRIHLRSIAIHVPPAAMEVVVICNEQTRVHLKEELSNAVGLNISAVFSREDLINYLKSQELFFVSEDIRVGSMVEARSPRYNIWYPGRISAVHKFGSYNIFFKDGSTEMNVMKHLIKPLGDLDTAEFLCILAILKGFVNITLHNTIEKTGAYQTLRGQYRNVTVHLSGPNNVVFQGIPHRDEHKLHHPGIIHTPPNFNICDFIKPSISGWKKDLFSGSLYGNVVDLISLMETIVNKKTYLTKLCASGDVHKIILNSTALLLKPVLHNLTSWIGYGDQLRINFKTELIVDLKGVPCNVCHITHPLQIIYIEPKFAVRLDTQLPECLSKSRLPLSPCTEIEQRSTSRWRELETIASGRSPLPICLGFVAFHGVQTINQTLESYRRLQLFDMVAEFIVLFQKIDTDERVAFQKWILRSFPEIKKSVTVVDNTIFESFKILINNCKSDYVIVLEEDFALIHGTNLSIANELRNAIYLLSNTTANSVFLRRRHSQGGEPDYAKMNWVRGGKPNKPPSNSSELPLMYVQWMEQAEDFFPSDQLQVVNLSPKSYLFPNTCFYTNNPTAYNRSYAVKLMEGIPHDIFRSVKNFEEFNHARNCRWAMGDGIFTHVRVDRAMVGSLIALICAA